MGFLSWIKNTATGWQQPVPEKAPQPKPENAKQMYRREAEEETANRPSMDRMPADQRARVDAIKERMQKATQQIGGNAQPPSLNSTHNDGREGARQNMAAQDQAAPALSPTSAQAGKTALEHAPIKAPEKAPEKPQEKPQEKPPVHAQTVGRARPSWQR